MYKFLTVLFSFLMMTGAVSSDEYFSHSIIKMPYEYKVDYPWLITLNKQEDLEAFFFSTAENILASGWDVKPMPEIDFDKYTLVVGGLGFQPNSSVKLALGEIRNSQSEIIIQAYKVVPDNGCPVDLAIVYPTIGILLDKTDKNIVGRLKEVKSSC